MTPNTNKKPNRDATLDTLVETFPAFRDAQPLAIGIHKTIRERLPTLSREQISKALRIHTSSTRYLKSLSQAKQRFDLDGQPAGDITEEQREAASKLVKERFRKAAEKRKADLEKQKAEEQARQQREKLEKLAAKFNSR